MIQTAPQRHQQVAHHQAASLREAAHHPDGYEGCETQDDIVYEA